MIISVPQLKTIGSEIQISAQIEIPGAKKGLFPPTLWFRFPEAFRDEILLDSSPFAVALLLLAMQRKETLRVEGGVSRKLLTGLDRYQEVYHSWFPDRFHRIEILAEIRELETSRNLPQNPPQNLQKNLQKNLKKPRVACAFSGGVDSFYTLLKNPQITDAVFMAGFDMPLNLKDSIQGLTTSYSKMMAQLGIRFVVGSTNIRNFVNTVDWTNAHGQALGATALFFQDCWDQFLIPSSYRSRSYPKWGTHPSLDPLLSTETLQFVHHGDEATRLDKLETLVKSPLTYDRLRVCWIQDIGLKNCGVCEKCVRTQVALEILGGRKLYSTFKEGEKGSLSARIRALSQRTYQSRLFARELLWAAIRRWKIKIAYDLVYSLIRRKMRRAKSSS